MRQGLGVVEVGRSLCLVVRHHTTMSVSQLLTCGSASSTLLLIHFASMQGKPKREFSC